MPLSYFLPYTFFFSIHFILFSYRDIIFNLHGLEDDFFETATAILAFVTALLFLISGKLGAHTSYLFAAAYLLFAFEEINWGQRIFGIDSPDYFKNYNWQKEINLHNFLNPIINYLYLPVFLIITSTFLSFKNGTFLFRFYRYPSIELLMKVSDRHNLHLILILCCVVSPAPFGAFEFLEQQFALFGFILSSIYLRAIVTKRGYG